MPSLEVAIKNFDDLEKILRKIIILLRVFLALSILGFSALSIIFGVANKLKSELHFFFLPAAFISALFGILLICFYCYNQISSIQEKIASITEILETDERHSPGALKVAIYETVREACDEMYSSTIIVVRILFFAPGVLVTIIGIILILVATINVNALRIITFSTGCVFIGVGICGMIFLIIGYKHTTSYVRRLHAQLDAWLSEQGALLDSLV